MQITCPNCSGRYLVDPAAIGSEGRIVQCSRCGHRWTADVGADDDAVPAPSALTDPRPVPDFISRPQDHGEPASSPAVSEKRMPQWLKVTLGFALTGLIVAAGYALAVGA